MMYEDQPLDKLGKTIFEGAFIVYASLLGRSAALQIGKVLKVARAPERAYASAYESGWRIRVQGVTTHFDGKPELLKPGTLMFPDRVAVIDDLDLPADVEALFR